MGSHEQRRGAGHAFEGESYLSGKNGFLEFPAADGTEQAVLQDRHFTQGVGVEQPLLKFLVLPYDVVQFVGEIDYSVVGGIVGDVVGEVIVLLRFGIGDLPKDLFGGSEPLDEVKFCLIYFVELLLGSHEYDTALEYNNICL